MPTRFAPTVAIVSIALFMVTLDNLIVTVALPSIRESLGASLTQLEWTVNAYVLAFAVALVPAAALGDRFGRRRVLLAGLAVFTLASALAALSPSTGALVAARALQGVGGALVAPLTLTILAASVPAERRGLALGIWSGVSGLGVAIGPLVGGAVVEGLAWQWIFWINVPIGLVLIPAALRVLGESRGPEGRMDLPGFALVGLGLLGVTFGLVEANAEGWTSPVVLGALAAGLLLLAAFVGWQRRAREPMVPLDLFAARGFTVTNIAAFFMFFGTFGSIFLLTQVLQFALGAGPLEAGVKMLVWTGATLVVAPIAGVLAERHGPRLFMAGGLGLQALALAWLAAVSEVGVGFGSLVVPFALAGAGMGLVFAPSAAAVLAAVPVARHGRASGVTNAVRETGGVFGVAVLAGVFAANGSYASPEAFLAGATPAVWVGAAVTATGALIALAHPRRRAAEAPVAAEPVAVAA
jgi:EmrB/QacA subfamily drug resistance transporter